MFRVAALLAVLGVLTSCQSENQEISRELVGSAEEAASADEDTADSRGLRTAPRSLYLTEALSFVMIMHKM